MRIPTILLLLFCYSSPVYSDDSHIQEARLSLKNYGLSHCVLKQFNEKSAIEKDISLSAGAYSFMGNGMHTVLQNEDTLKTLHDPYKETREYVFNAYDKVLSRSKHSDKKVVFYGCLSVYNSLEFDDFIKTQDQYISE